MRLGGVRDDISSKLTTRNLVTRERRGSGKDERGPRRKRKPFTREFAVHERAQCALGGAQGAAEGWGRHGSRPLGSGPAGRTSPLRPLIVRFVPLQSQATPTR